MKLSYCKKVFYTKGVEIGMMFWCSQVNTYCSVRDSFLLFHNDKLIIIIVRCDKSPSNSDAHTCGNNKPVGAHAHIVSARMNHGSVIVSSGRTES